MNYYHIAGTILSNIVGGRGNGQINNIRGYSFDKLNNDFNKFDSNLLKEIAKSVFELRYDAKITDIITGIPTPNLLWIVNLDFLKVINGMNVYPYYLEPAILSYRGKYIEDYFLFQPALQNYGLELVDFKLCKFEIQYKYPDKLEPVAIHSIEEYLLLAKDLKKNFPKVIGEIKLRKLVFIANLPYDFFCIRHLPLAYTVNQVFIDQLIKHKIKGALWLKLSFDPFEIVWPKPEELYSLK